MTTLPTLYSLTRDKQIQQWTVSTSKDIVITEHGLLNGKQIKHMDRVRSTNVGRANQRVGETQAEAEAKSAWDKKRKTGYFETIEEARSTTVYLPMLAHPLEKEILKANGERVKSKIEIDWTRSNGVDIQRKYNGLRGLAVPGIFIGSKKPMVIRSREAEEWENLGHIEEHLGYLCFAASDGNWLFDGEIYQHGVPLQTLNSLVKRKQDGTEQLKYYIYDMPSFHHWSWRRAQLETVYRRYVATRATALGLLAGEAFVRDLPLQLAPTSTVQSEEEARLVQRMYVAEGYEGAILRQKHLPYEFNFRCESIIKLKDFIDANFEIVDVLSRELLEDGKAPVVIVDKFVFRNNLSEATFEAVPKGSLAQRAEWWEMREEIIGRFGIVRFHERSVDGIPQNNPTVVAIRLDEDCGGAEGEEFWG